MRYDDFEDEIKLYEKRKYEMLEQKLKEMVYKI